MKQTDLTDSSLAVAASRFAALGSEQRLTVLRTLVRAGPEGLTTGELGQRCGITGATLTHHMKTLTQAGLAAQTRRGRALICTAADFEEIQGLTEFLLSECCAEAPNPLQGDPHE